MKFIAIIALACALTIPAHAGLIITGVIDGPLPGGLPKGIELYATNTIADLSQWNVASVTNGGDGTVSPEFALNGTANAGDFIYVASESTEFSNYLGITPDFVNGVANINGDDPIVILNDPSGSFSGSETIYDVFGALGKDGTGEPWEYMDGWAYRADGTGPDSSFVLGNWTFSGPDALDGTTTNPSTDGFPIGTYVPEPSSFLMLGILGIASLAFRRRG